MQLKQYADAVQYIADGQPDAARPLLQTLLLEPALLEQQQAPLDDSSSGNSNSSSSRSRSGQPCDGSDAAASTRTSVVVVPQSRALAGMRFRALVHLAPLLGVTDAALMTWAEALRYTPCDARAWESVSLLLCQLGHLEHACAAAARAAELAPGNLLLHERLVLLLAAARDWDAAGQALLGLAAVAGGYHHPW